MLSSEEIFGLAKEIERSGHAYYRTIADSTASADLKELFDYLAEQELAHYRFFDQLSRDYPELEVDGEEWEQTSAYIKATSDSRFFVGEDKAISLARTVKEPLAAIDIAIGFEKDTLLFF
jgi:rubrerythrin